MSVPEYGVPDYVRMARHEWDLSDAGHEVVELAVTNETDASLVLAPDGAGGVEFRAESGGSEPIATAHVADATDAHDASAVSVVDADGHYVGADVETVLDEIGDALQAAAGIWAPVLVSNPQIVTLDGSPVYVPVALDGGPLLVKLPA